MLCTSSQRNVQNVKVPLDQETVSRPGTVAVWVITYEPSGSVTSLPPEIVVGPQCSEQVPAASVVQVPATVWVTASVNVNSAELSSRPGGSGPVGSTPTSKRLPTPKSGTRSGWTSLPP